MNVFYLAVGSTWPSPQKHLSFSGKWYGRILVGQIPPFGQRDSLRTVVNGELVWAAEGLHSRGWGGYSRGGVNLEKCS